MNTSTTWQGVVMIMRPDLTKMSYGDDPLCHVQSAKTVQLGGYAAIDTYLPFELYAHLFSTDDGDHIFAEAEYKDGHLEVLGKTRPNIKEWVIHSMTEQQAGGKVFTGYV